MKRFEIILLLLLTAGGIIAQNDEPAKIKPSMTEVWDPEVRMVTPGLTPQHAPSDAVVLFDGTDLESEWISARGGKPGWKVEDGCVTVVKGTGKIHTKRKFSDVQLHIEWRTPAEVVGKSQGRGNSGVFLQERYEVQVLDSYNNRTYRNGQAGSIYKQHAPLVNASKGPGEWQTYDIIYTAPRFNDDGTCFSPPVITVLHNGVLVQNQSKVRGPTIFTGIPEYAVEPHGAGSITLQEHGNPVSYRNIWVREL
jgi:hypothetical protein